MTDHEMKEVHETKINRLGRGVRDRIFDTPPLFDESLPDFDGPQPDLGPIPPGIHVDGVDIRMREILCPRCAARLGVFNVEVMPSGFRLGCKCGLDILEIG